MCLAILIAGLPDRELSEEAKILYFMNNLNDSIFGDVKANFMDLSTRALFPQTYEEIKQRIIAEYSQISTRKPQTVFKVLRGDDTRRYGEASFKAEEDGCHICGIPGHFYRTCKFFNKKYSLEQNQRYYKKITESSQGEPTRGGVTPRAGGATGKRGGTNSNSRANKTGAQNTNYSSDGEEKHEQARVAKEHDLAGVIDAGLGDEEFELICTCEGNTNDLLLGTGTVSNLVPEKTKERSRTEYLQREDYSNRHRRRPRLSYRDWTSWSVRQVQNSPGDWSHLYFSTSVWR